MRIDSILSRLLGWIKARASESASERSAVEDLVQEGLVVLVEVSIKYGDKTLDDVVNISMRSINNRFVDIARRRYSAGRLERMAARPEEVMPVVERRLEERDLVAFIRTRLEGTDQFTLDMTMDGCEVKEIVAMTDRSRATIYRSLNRIKTLAMEQGVEV